MDVLGVGGVRFSRRDLWRRVVGLAVRFLWERREAASWTEPSRRHWSTYYRDSFIRLTFPGLTLLSMSTRTRPNHALSR